MEPTLITSVLGLIFFVVIMLFGFKYANGQWNVSESKKSEYQQWTKKHGKKTKKSLTVLCIIFGIAMLTQIVSLL